MRWDALFDDLQAQADELERTERAAEVETRSRAELGTITFADRARAALGNPIQLWLVGGVPLAGSLQRVGPDWLLLQDTDRETLVASVHVQRARGLGRAAAGPESIGVVERRLGLRSALRAVARDRSGVRVHLAGNAPDVGVLDGTLDRVGADFIDIAMHSPGELRRRADVREIATVLVANVAALRRLR